MIKLFSFELRKLFRGKGFWISLVILSLIVVGSLITIAQLTNLNTNEIGLGEDNKALVLSVEGEQEYTGRYVLVSALNGQLPLILSVFLAFFIASDFSQGIIKNVLVRGYSRTSIAISKVFITIISTVLLALVCLAAAAITGTVLWSFGDNIDGKLFAIVGVQILVSCAIASLYMFIAMLCRKSGIAVAVSVVSMSVLNMIISLVSNLFHTVKIKEYHLPNLLSNISNSDVTWNLLGKTTIIALVYIVILSLLSIIHFRKVDV